MATSATAEILGNISPSKPKNILLTGGAGFIGSNTTIHLVNKYPLYNFYVLDNLSYAANLKNLSSIESAKNYKFVRGSITSPDLMRHIFIEYDINIVIHFAAETHVDHSFGHSFAFTNTNVLGTHILLECARRNFQQLDRKTSTFDLFIHVSTDEVYGESKMNDTYQDAMKETDRLLPTNPYSASKAAAEQIVLSYSKSFKLPIIVTRSSNVYGPRQFPEKMIPKFVHLISMGKPVCIYGNGLNTRVYIHASDIAKAFDLLLHKGTIGDIYNITNCEVELNTIQVVEAMLACFEHLDESECKKYIQFVRDRPFHDSRYYMNGDKMKALGWKTEMSFKDGLKQTVDWYLSHPNHWKNLDDVLVPHPTVRHESNEKYGGDVKEEEN